MAALCPGVQYGLSSQENFGENKDLIFVKLTDSAIRTIEEYLRNQSKFTKNPTIKFLGNEGLLSFPTHNGNTNFKFSVSSTTDMEGPGGSFECVQQAPRGSLSVMGPVSHKIRIHANDDVYETTRHRMSVLEENTKNKCAREIKMNQTDIGRKVKVKQGIGARSVPPIRRETPPLRESLGSKSSYNNTPNLPSKPPAPLHTNNGLSNGLGSNHVSSSKPPQNKPSMPDIARRPIKERMIHLLALRPFKKPELYERLMREGLREKNAMTSVLKQIACLKDNSYHLNRAMWNDVHEDWPFYTDSERQALKRRKPQNLTPPGSSDGGSSGSGHSPTSTHPGSPPPPVSSSKRPGYYDGADGLVTKRQRISHYRKPSEQTYRSPVENNSQRRPMTDSRDASNMNPRSRESPTNGYPPPITNGYSTLNDKRNISDDEEQHIPSRKRVCDSHSEKTPPKILDDVRNKDVLAETTQQAIPDIVNNGSRNKHEERERRDKDRWNKVSSSTQNSRITRVSPDSQSDRISIADSGPPPRTKNVDIDKPEFPDYLNEYSNIRDIDQRRRYKAEFNADYAEYRQLHGIVEKVSRRFAELEERLKQEDTSSPKYKDIKKQIVKEYQQNKQDQEHQRAKQRFQYLHDKLSHIKRLVCKYDKEMADNQY